MLCQENELCLWHVKDATPSGSAYDETEEELRIEDELELLGKVAHCGDVTDLLVSYMWYTQVHIGCYYQCISTEPNIIFSADAVTNSKLEPTAAKVFVNLAMFTCFSAM